MGRRRYVSTDISVDPRIADLTLEAGPYAALLYTWLIPHADDTGAIPGNPRQIKLQVVPGLDSCDVQTIAESLEVMLRLGLLVDDSGVLRFPPSFYKHQSYIKEERRKSAQISANPRTAPTPAQNAASSSSSFPVSSSEPIGSGGAPIATTEPEPAASSPSAPPPEVVPTSRVKPAPKPEPKRDRFRETLDAVKALDPDVVIGGDRSRNARAVNEAMAEPALIAEAYVALMRGEWQDSHVAKQGSLHAVVDNIGGFVNSKRAPPPHRNGSARASPTLSALATLGADEGYFDRDWEAELGGSHGTTNGTIKPD